MPLSIRCTAVIVAEEVLFNPCIALKPPTDLPARGESAEASVDAVIIAGTVKFTSTDPWASDPSMLGMLRIACELSSKASCTGVCVCAAPEKFPLVDDSRCSKIFAEYERVGERLCSTSGETHALCRGLGEGTAADALLRVCEALAHTAGAVRVSKPPADTLLSGANTACSDSAAAVVATASVWSLTSALLCGRYVVETAKSRSLSLNCKTLSGIAPVAKVVPVWNTKGSSSSLVTSVSTEATKMSPNDSRAANTTLDMQIHDRIGDRSAIIQRAARRRRSEASGILVSVSFLHIEAKLLETCRTNAAGSSFRKAKRSQENCTEAAVL